MSQRRLKIKQEEKGDITLAALSGQGVGGLEEAKREEEEVYCVEAQNGIAFNMVWCASMQYTQYSIV